MSIIIKAMFFIGWGSFLATPTVCQNKFCLVSNGFVPNYGQWKIRSLYRGVSGPFTVFSEDAGWTLVVAQNKVKRQSFAWNSLPDSDHEKKKKCLAIEFDFLYSSNDSGPEPNYLLPGKFNFFFGKDPDRWHSELPLWKNLYYSNMYKGVDVFLHCRRSCLKYDLFFHPFVPVSICSIRIKGALGLRVRQDGCLIVDTGIGKIIQPVPIAWELLPDGGKRFLDCQYVLKGPFVFGFQVKGRTETNGFMIDPNIVFSSYLGGSKQDKYLTSVQVDKFDKVFVCGGVSSIDYPVTRGVYDRSYNGGDTDAILTCFDRNAKKLVFSTYLGGKGNEGAEGIQLTSSGDIVVAGCTNSPDFPVTKGTVGQQSRGWDGYILKLNRNGSKLFSSSYLGGSLSDYIDCLFVDKDDRVTVAGGSDSKDFPVTQNVWDAKPSKYVNIPKGFVSQLNSNLDVVYFSTYIGGDHWDSVNDLRVTVNREIVVVGETESNNFPTTKLAWSRSHPMAPLYRPGFITVINPTGSGLLYSSYLGGKTPQFSNRWGFWANSVSIDSLGSTVTIGGSAIGSFPTTNSAFDRAAPSFPFGKGAIARIHWPSGKVVFATYFGLSAEPPLEDQSEIFDLITNDIGEVVITGWARSKSNVFPITPNAFIKNFPHDPKWPSWMCSSPAYVAKIGNKGRKLLYSTLLGGTGGDSGMALTLDSMNNCVVGGCTGSLDFVTTKDCFDPSANWRVSSPNQDRFDFFISKLPLSSVGVTRIGQSSSNCLGEPAIYVNSDPIAGEPGFGFTCWKAPPFAPGVLLLGRSLVKKPLSIFGIDLWVDPSGKLIDFAFTSNFKGISTVNLPIPKNVTGGTLGVQYFWMNTQSCPGPFALSSSSALEVNIQN